MDKETKETPLSVRREAIYTEGRLSYSESVGAWNLVRLKSELLHKLPKLKDKKANIKHRITYYFTYEELLNMLQEMKKSGDPLPLLLFFEEITNNS